MHSDSHGHLQFWEEMTSLYSFALGDVEGLAGSHACFCLRLSDVMIRTADSVLIKAWIDDEAQLRNSGRVLSVDITKPPVEARKVVLRASFQDYDFLLKHVCQVKLIQAFVHHSDGLVVLDATAAPSFFSGQRPVTKEATIQVAELFAGGFAGWSRAIGLLQHTGVKVHTSWCLERAADCIPPLQAQHPDMMVADATCDVTPVLQPTDTIMFHADFNSTWWRPAASARPVQAFCVSPPCQPWSTASSQSGLNAPDGLLILQVVDYLKVMAPALVVYEQVDGFSKHPHFPVFFHAMEQAGFSCVWRGSLQLSDIAPTSRRRYFLVWRHRENGSDHLPFQHTSWMSLKAPSLRACRALFDHLPSPLLAPCMLSSEVMQMYMSPELLPANRHGQACRDPAQFRVVTGQQQIGCIMAMYHRQHELPLHLLQRKGLLGHLIDSQQGIRFMASPEVASAHGACEVMLLVHDDRTCMRQLGNSLSCQQAIMTLAMALRTFPQLQHMPEPAACVQFCNERRMHSENTLLLEVQQGWLMCDVRHLPQVLARVCLKAQISNRLLPGQHRFKACQVVAGEGRHVARFGLCISQHIQLEVVLRDLQLGDATVTEQSDPCQCKVDCGTQPSFPLIQCTRPKGADHPSLYVLAGDTCFVLHRSTYDVFQQLRQAFEHVRYRSDTAVACFNLAGTRISNIPDMPRTVLLVPESQHLLQEEPQWHEAAMHQVCRLATPAGVTFQIPNPQAPDWWLSFPGHLMPSVGWKAEHSAFPPPEPSPFILSAVAEAAGALFSTSNVVEWMRVLLFLAPIRQAAVDARLGATQVQPHKVEIQVVAKTIWQGVLPGRITLLDILRWWEQTSFAMALSPAARIYSGPFPQLHEHSIQELNDCNTPSVF